MSKKSNNVKAAVAAAVNADAQTPSAKPARAAKINWPDEVATMNTAAKDKFAGSRGDALGKVATYIADDKSPGALLLRAAAAQTGAQLFIDSPRNVLAKLPKLATCIAAAQPWCSVSALLPENKRKEDASVAIALVGLGAGNARQKAIVAEASKRYPGGANAQMPAALDACVILGIVERKAGGPRNAEYVIADEVRASKLIPVG